MESDSSVLSHHVQTLSSLHCHPVRVSLILFACVCSFLQCFNTQVREVLIFFCRLISMVQ